MLVYVLHILLSLAVVTAVYLCVFLPDIHKATALPSGFFSTSTALLIFKIATWVFLL